MVLASLFLAGWAGLSAAPPHEYSLSVEVEYGRQPSRRSYVEQMQRKLEAWARVRGALHAPVTRGEATLHLQVIVDEVERGRDYAKPSRQRDVFLDMPGSASSPYVYRTRFELRVAVLDVHQGNRVVVQDEFTIYNEVRETRLVTHPEQRSWEDNLQFMVDRIRRFLARRKGEIERYLSDSSGLSVLPPGSDEPR